MCTVFSVYDMRKDFLIRYPGLARNTAGGEKTKINNGDEEDVSIPYWYLSSTESLNSKMASLLGR